MAEDIPVLNYETIARPFSDLLIATENKLDREWPQERDATGGPQVLVRSLVLVSANTYHTMRFFCADVPVDSVRKPEYALSASPLARTILDALFTVVFIFDDLSENTTWYYKSGWKEYKAELDRYRLAYSADPVWTEYLRRSEQLLDALTRQFRIVPDEIRDPGRITWWPTPSQMAAYSRLSEERQRYLQYLNDWFMRELSQDSHLSWPGLARRSGPLLARDLLADSTSSLLKQKSDVMAVSTVLLLALLSEIEIEFHFGLVERLMYLWGILNSYFQVSSEIFSLRYSARLRCD
ncbi:MAG: hypothetical protein M0042_11395 [Nitrospiraceae bacterium]|nr:hypothetical protein [Nitrospiraceae bacterium]